MSGALTNALDDHQDDGLLFLRDTIATTSTGVLSGMSSLVTILDPQATICSIGAPQTRHRVTPVRRQNSPLPWLDPNANDTFASSSPSNCTVAYARKVTSLCNTTLTPLGDMPITVSDCNQRIVFRTDHGIVTMRGGPAILQTTMYFATWSDVATGIPTGLVQAQVCEGSGSCTTYDEQWATSEEVFESTTTSTVSIHTILSGVKQRCSNHASCQPSIACCRLPWTFQDNDFHDSSIVVYVDSDQADSVGNIDRPLSVSIGCR